VRRSELELPPEAGGNWKPPEAARVVVVKVSDTLPMVSVVFVAVELVLAVVCRTCTVAPLFTVPVAVVNAPPLTE